MSDATMSAGMMQQDEEITSAATNATSHIPAIIGGFSPPLSKGFANIGR